MPCSYIIDKPRQLVLTTGTGLLTLSESIHHQNSLQSDIDFSPSFAQLIDLTEVTSTDVDGEGVRRLAEKTVFGPNAFRAFVGSSPWIFGMLRMMQTVREMKGAQETIKVFHDLPSAWQWLSEVHPPGRQQP
jgi:hypothetical protein